ncbi:DUF1574 family protein [Fischerella thermalis]|uniref:DUF1574 family protein n=1 Tax=Fischerella thermalis TaxID=372787 RepID=UPI001A070D14|nr:DUF1574 family protein [Fischerella thermalis]MBF1988704.1 DUF1574 family protein [Fischerella thermalis M58_A2018_009]MBF2061243.1 DUF1574 family protein [Fischerella thermalis M66_A2018_004]MBF2069076.1 DUF1574 family protein [Fischerella thermalis M48_A2018_028]
MKIALPVSQKSLIQWVSQATGISSLGVKVRLRGNELHILCESPECPQRWRTLVDLLHALQHTDLDALTKSEQPSIYQVFVYGRKKGENRPQWCHQVFLNQLDLHLQQVEQALIADAEKSSRTGGALILSNESLARKGDPDAIARYLSESLSTFGIGVEVKAKKQQPTLENPSNQNRLLIYCQSSYTPDPSLIAEPVAQKLRSLKLSGYQDAVIATQVDGETDFDWMLRVDLTPPEIMLKEWARWGDLQAIARILNERLSALAIKVTATLKESTLHIFCSPADPKATEQIPDKTQCLQAIMPQLQALAPQGILATTVYGHQTIDHEPAWIDWQSLPATEHPDLAVSALELSSAGDEPAIIFLLERLLNPDIDTRLKTGGTRVLLLRKGDLLHIMCEALVCPSRKQVASKVTQFVRQLKIVGIAGVRVYGRRAGNKEPFWHYGVDFINRQRLVPEPTPEFAATAAYVGELLTPEANEPVLRPDLTSQDVQSIFVEVAQDWGARIRRWLLATQLFAEKEQSQEQQVEENGWRVALVWGLLGFLLTLQSDWILGYITSHSIPETPKIASTRPQLSSAEEQNQRLERTVFFTNTSPASKNQVFNASGFTQKEESITRGKATATAILLAARSPMPSFNARQLDEQLALYKQRLAKNGKPPDVLIIGSSRALRGIDPTTLSQALATQGYSDIDVFNFGINGATAQVVDFILRRVLQPSELPKLIIWADGARAFNNGREDVTFKAIAASPGYQQVLQKAPANENSQNSNTTSASIKPEQSFKNTTHTDNNSQALDARLNQALATISTTYNQRNQLKSLLNKTLKSLPLLRGKSAVNQKITSADPEQDVFEQAVDFDGFLAIPIRFNPATYYQKHPKVNGSYDNDYKSFQLGGEQDAALQAVLQFCASKKIPIVFVNMPLSAEYLDSVRKNYEQDFQQYMLRLAENSNLIYRDLSLIWPQANENFSDPSHLNLYGAEKVSRKLAIDPMIPWPTK